MAIRVLIVDDDEAVRLTLSRALGSQKDIDVVGEATDGHEALDLATRLALDVIVMDVQMPKMSGLDVTKRLRATGVDTPVLILTADTRVAGKVRRLSGVKLLLKGQAGIADTLHAIRSLAGAA